MAENALPVVRCGCKATNFTLSQVLQFLAMVAAGMLAFGNLKGDLREGFALLGARLEAQERRITRLEDAATERLRLKDKARGL